MCTHAGAYMHCNICAAYIAVHICARRADLHCMIAARAMMSLRGLRTLVFFPLVFAHRGSCAWEVVGRMVMV